MPSTDERNIKVVPDVLPNLISDVAHGRYRIPQFQREYVWPRSKVLELFDSVYKEFPIGSFFIWKAGRDHNSLFRQLVGLEGVKAPQADEDVSFILDGQQRITSLYVALKGTIVNGTDYGRICFDLEKTEFTYRAPDNQRYVAVRDLWGDQALKLSRQIPAEYVDAYDRCYQTLRTYPVSIVEVSDKDLPAVCKIFQRINQSGKRLDRFDLVSAMTFTRDFDLRTRFKEEIAFPLEKRNFGAIDPSIITQLLALRVHGQCTEQYEYGLTSETIQKHWKSATEAVLLAADTLRKSVGVKTADYLPYNAMLTLLSYYFMVSAKRSLAAAELEWVTRWFWRASFAQYYGRSAPTQIGRDKGLFDSLAKGVVPKFETTPRLTVPDLVKTRMTWRGSAIRNAFLCLLANIDPVDLQNNGSMDVASIPVSDFTKSEKHHIFPRGFLEREGPTDAEIHSLPNFCFLTAELNKRIADKAPAVYIAELEASNPEFAQAARTHLLPTGPDSGIPSNAYLTFLQARGKMIIDEIGRLCGGISTPREEERQAAVRALETQIRDGIHTVLSEAVGGGYWTTSIPGDVRQGADDRIQAALKKHPDLQPEHFDASRPRLDYLNVPDYRTIIESRPNWPHFKPIFHNLDDVKNHFKAFNDYRNSVMHNRSDMTEYVRMAGETALIWLNAVLSPQEEPQDGEGQEDE